MLQVDISKLHTLDDHSVQQRAFVHTLVTVVNASKYTCFGYTAPSVACIMTVLGKITRMLEQMRVGNGRGEGCSLLELLSTEFWIAPRGLSSGRLR